MRQAEDDWATPAPVSDVGDCCVHQLAAGAAHCIMLAGTRVLAWGSASFGQLGLGAAVSAQTRLAAPMEVTSLAIANITAVAAGRNVSAFAGMVDGGGRASAGAGGGAGAGAGEQGDVRSSTYRLWGCGDTTGAAFGVVAVFDGCVHEPTLIPGATGHNLCLPTNGRLCDAFTLLFSAPAPVLVSCAARCPSATIAPNTPSHSVDYHRAGVLMQREHAWQRRKMLLLLARMRAQGRAQPRATKPHRARGGSAKRTRLQ